MSLNPLRPYLAGLAAILLLAALGAGGYAVWSYKRMAGEIATANARIDAAEKKADEAARLVETLSAETMRRADVDKAIREARQTITINLDEVQREDPVSRDYLGERIPDGVRNAVLAPEVR